MKSVILFVAFFALALTLEVPSCWELKASCVANEQHCTILEEDSKACADCVTELGTCLATADANTTCECYTNATNCLANTASCGTDFGVQLCQENTEDCNCQSNAPIKPIAFCSSGYCDSDSVCKAFKDIGESCTENEECGTTSFDWRPRHCNSSGRCDFNGAFAFPGDACRTSDDCYGNEVENLVNCTDGVCVGISGNETCYGLGCAFGLACIDTVCEESLPPGDNCTTSTECGVGFVCNGDNGCESIFSVAADGECVETEVCQLGLVCTPASNDDDDSDDDESDDDDSERKTCSPVAPVKSCVNDTDCPLTSGYTKQCECNYLAAEKQCGIVYPEGPAACRTQLSSLVTCAIANKCFESIAYPGSCLATNCHNQYECFYQCLYRDVDECGYHFDFDCPSPTTSTTGTEDTTGSASSITASLMFATVLAVVAAF